MVIEFAARFIRQIIRSNDMFAYWRNRLLLMFIFGLLGGSAIGWADEPTDSQHSGVGQRAEDGGHHIKPSRGLGLAAFSYLEIEDLKLSDQQEELWQKAQEATDDAIDRTRIINRDLHDQMRVDLDQPGADLKQIIQRQDEARINTEAVFKQAREAWFTAYDSLNADQKEQLREAVREGMDTIPTSSISPLPLPPPPPPSAQNQPH